MYAENEQGKLIERKRTVEKEANEATGKSKKKTCKGWSQSTLMIKRTAISMNSNNSDICEEQIQNNQQCQQKC